MHPAGESATNAFDAMALQRQKRLPEQAADRIAQMILERQLPVGTQLPSERQLAQSLGVSRTVVREAIRMLEARKLISMEVGGTATVHGFTSESVTESITMLMGCENGDVSFDDVQAVRGMLEVGIAGLAARMATAEDLDRIQDALDRMMNPTSVEDQVQADYDLHLRIAEATHNKLCVFFLQALNDIMVKTWKDYWSSHTELGPEDYIKADMEVAESNMCHAEIVEAIRQRDEHVARQWMGRMLEHWGSMYTRYTGGK